MGRGAACSQSPRGSWHKMSKTLDCVGKCIGFLGVEGEAEASNSKALLEKGQQHRAQGKAQGGIAAEVNSPGPNWGHFNPFSWINTECGSRWPWCHQPSPGRRDDRASAPTWFSIPAVAVLNPAQQPAQTHPYRKNGKTPKWEQARKASLHSICMGHGRPP